MFKSSGRKEITVNISIPERLQPIVWSRNKKDLDYKKDRIYIIHQVLAYGSMEDIKLILKVYKKDDILDVFINFPKKVYTKAVFLFIKNFLLKIHLDLDLAKYVKNIN